MVQGKRNDRTYRVAGRLGPVTFAMLYYAGLASIVVLSAVLTAVYVRATARYKRPYCAPVPGGIGSPYAVLPFMPWMPPTRALRNLKAAIHWLTLISTIAVCGAIYVSIADGSRPGECDLCQFDPRGRSAGFWFQCYLCVSLFILSTLGGILLERLGIPRAREAFDSRRVRVLFDAVFRERLEASDAGSLRLSTLLRWTVLLFMLTGIVGVFAIVYG
ncbi:hypothetical protein SAMN02800694_1887 [Luteibacter sp. UNCMF331Sha3.1]|nr:hypothetical protein SAMN02800694_1887 [Luteibacter sp. UNCMF331Sha3.1]